MTYHMLVVYRNAVQGLVTDCPQQIKTVIASLLGSHLLSLATISHPYCQGNAA
jgi:hypothetical protein